MWAAANDRRRRDKRRRTGGAAGGNEDYRGGDAKKKSYDGSDTDSEYESSDGERSTTESVNDDGGPTSSSSGKNLFISSPSARIENGTLQTGAGDDAAAAAFGHQSKNRKRKRKKKRKKRQIREETPEAAIARLISSYTAAMAAIGALHRLSGHCCAFWKEEGKSGGGVLDASAVKANCDPPSNTNEVDEGASSSTIKEGNDDIETPQRDNKASDSNEILREAYTSIQRVARAARSALEQSLLLDHIIMAPIFLPEKESAAGKTKRGDVKNNARCENDALEVMSSAWLDVWNRSSNDTSTAHFSQNARMVNTAFQTISMTKWNKLSTAHRKEIRKVAYLALVNYADLLLCVCHASGATNRKRDVLDRGAVPKLGVIELFSTMVTTEPGKQQIDDRNDTNRLWSDESTERTVRLALAAYVDASELDPTDPTLWFKLACATRALGWEMHSSSPKSLRVIKRPPRSHRCLERLALERGLSSLPQGLPPNRLLLHAWKELENWDRGPPVNDVEQEIVPDENLTREEDKPIELVLHLPRYSWVTLGTILMRASQEGVSYGRSLPGTPRHVWSTSCQFSDHDEFGSPLVDIRLAPILAVPPRILGLTCEYLEGPDVKRLACTCRTMPSGLKSARDKLMAEKKQANAASPEKDAFCPINATLEDTANETTIDETSATSGSKSKNNRRGVDIISPPHRGRVSKRVRSHMITTEKQAERKSKRSSVEYCLLAGTLSCTAQNPYYTKLLADSSSQHLPLFSKCMQAPPALSQAIDEGPGLNSADSLDANKIARSSHMGHMNPFLSPTSLNEFILKWSRHNSGPRDLLEEFLLHVSLNASDIFQGEVSDSLSSCITDCFDMMISIAERNAASTPRYGTTFIPWYGAETCTDVSVLAVNLLHAELVFKRCESHDIGSQEYQEDSDVLAFVVPNLLSLMRTSSQLDRSEDIGMRILEVQCRCFWLASSYYLWVSRCSNDASTSKTAEEFGLQYLDEAIGLLRDESQQNGLKIMTLHLESSVRRGEHWRVLSVEALSQYKEHLQSSSIVSRARQCFQNIQLELKERPGSSSDEICNLSVDNKATLVSLGADLLERYNVNSEKSTEVMDELLGDFIMLNEDQFHPPDANAISSGSFACPEVRWGRIWVEIPSSKAEISVSREGSRPSIIQVLATSLMMSKETTPSVFLIYSKLALAALLSRAKKLLRLNDIPQIHVEESQLESTKHDDSPVDGSRTGRDHLLIGVVNFFIDKMTDIIASYTNEAENHEVLEAYLVGEDFCGLISASLDTLRATQKHHIDDSTLHTYLLESVSRLVLNLRSCQEFSRLSLEKIESVYFVALTKSLTRFKMDFTDLTSSVHDKRTKKWHSRMISKSHLAFLTANEIAELLSLHPTRIGADASARVSHLIKSLSGVGKEDSYALLAQLTEALLWFWGFLTNTYDASSPTENSVRNMLTVPIASALVSLCGSPGVSIEGAQSRGENRSDKNAISFSDYFDSEDSVNRVCRTGTETDGEDELSRRTLLRKVCQLVQCVSIVFRSVNEKLINQETTCRMFPSSQHGPFLPLVVVRVLSTMSEGIFQLFSENVWGEAYPYGARECGSTIDLLLGRAYSHLYGFSFSSGDPDTSKSYAPESISAAIHLFRSIKRVYHDNRKTPPSKAFETIELALPPEEESEISKAINAFLFDADKNSEVVNRTPTITTGDLPSGFPEWVFEAAEGTSSSADEHQNNIALLRRGVAHELAKGSMATLDSSQKSPSDMDDQGLTGEREETQSHERSLHQKFRGVLCDLSYNPKNIERWIVLSECLGFKAEDICDRLVLVRKPSSDFCLNSKSKRQYPATMSLDQLQRSQLEDYQESRSHNWKPFLGNNLLLYMQHPWTSFSSLQACAQEVRSSITETDTDMHDSDYPCWKEIEAKFEEGNYVSWANAWAGMFIMALRTMRLKALLVARYLAKNSQKGMHPSEVSEELGTALYSELQFSTVYGYPVHPMTLHEKRSIAERSNFFFQEAVDLSSSCDYTQKCHVQAFELYFMIGKGSEKIASTVQDEIYALESEGDCRTRLYETVMNESILNYSKALADAQKVEQSSGGNDKIHTGGSSHGGALEGLYRLHASRFKVLLSAVRRASNECEQAELESFRIASAMWFDKSNESSSVTGVRGKTWDILADCVDAFNHCRTEIPLFHRAAYRLAQAYNYAPLFHSPNCDLIVGSRQAVPAIKSYRIRGLSSSCAAESADVVISKLFDKRRAQICAVWVTTSPAPSPFEVLNDSIRKYDALRFKYIEAYIECMRLSEQKDRIEILLNWAATSNQDLAGYYEASAALRGGDPGKHTKQSLLSGNGFIAKVKRNASNALAEIILQDLAHMKKNGIDNDGKVKLTAHFKLAYTLFLRLNSSCKEVAEFIRSHKLLAEAEALCKCYLSIQAGYRMSSIDFNDMDSETLCSILEGATSKAKAIMHEIKAASSKKEKEKN